MVALALLRYSPKEESGEQGSHTPIKRGSQSVPDLVCSVSASRIRTDDSSADDSEEEKPSVESLMNLLELSADLVDLACVCRRVDAPRLLADAADLSEQILLAVFGACRKLPLFAVNAEDWAKPTGRWYPSLTRKQLSVRRKEAILRIINEEDLQEANTKGYTESFLHPFDYSSNSPSFHDRLRASPWFADLFEALVKHTYTLQRPQDKPMYIARIFAAVLSIGGPEREIRLASIEMYHSLCTLVAEETLCCFDAGEVYPSSASLYKTLAFVAEVQSDDGGLEAGVDSSRLTKATNALISLARRLLLECFVQRGGFREGGGQLEESLASFVGSSYLPRLLTHIQSVPEAERKSLLLAGCRLGLSAEALAIAANPIKAESPARRKRVAIATESGRKKARVSEYFDGDAESAKRLDFGHDRGLDDFADDEGVDHYEDSSLFYDDEEGSISSVVESPRTHSLADVMTSCKEEDLSWIVADDSSDSAAQDPLSSARLQPAYAEFVANLFWDPSLS